MPKKPYRIERWTGKDWRYCTSTATDEGSAKKARQLGAEYGDCSMRVLNTGEPGWPSTYTLQGGDAAVFSALAPETTPEASKPDPYLLHLGWDHFMGATFDSCGVCENEND